MTRHVWKIHRPQYDGHTPKDWAYGMEYRYRHLCVKEPSYIKINEPPAWLEGLEYIYDPAQIEDAKPDLLAQCLALPQADREALIEALQKPVRDWADAIAEEAWREYEDNSYDGMAMRIRSMCRPKEDGRSEEFEHVAYYDDCEFHWMSGIVARDCELFARRKESLK